MARGPVVSGEDGFVRAPRNGLSTLTHFLHSTLGRMDSLIPEPFDRMSRLVGALSNRVDDHVAAFPPDEVSPLCCIFEAVDGGLVRELHRFDGAIGSLHGNGLRGRVNFMDGAS